MDIITLIYPFSSVSLSLGEGPIETEILSQRAVKPKTTNQLRLFFQLKYFCYWTKSIFYPIQGFIVFLFKRGWSGGAKVLGKLPVPGRPTILNTVGQGPTALAAGAGGGCLDIFTLIYPFSSLSPSLWETARYRLKYCLKGPLNPKQPTKISFQAIR